MEYLLYMEWEAEDALWEEEWIFILDEEYKKRILQTCGPSILSDLDMFFEVGPPD